MYKLLGFFLPIPDPEIFAWAREVAKRRQEEIKTVKKTAMDHEMEARALAGKNRCEGHLHNRSEKERLTEVEKEAIDRGISIADAERLRLRRDQERDYQNQALDRAQCDTAAGQDWPHGTIAELADRITQNCHHTESLLAMLRNMELRLIGTEETPVETRKDRIVPVPPGTQVSQCWGMANHQADLLDDVEYYIGLLARL